MKRTRMSVSVFSLVLFLGFALSGCDDSTGPSGTGRIALNSSYTKSALPAPNIVLKQSGGMVVDSIVITRARFLIRDVTFKNDADSLEFKSAPFVLELNLLGGSNQIVVRDVSQGTYDRVEFDVHRIDSIYLAGLPPSEQLQFTDFMSGDRYSMIIEGTMYQTGQGPASFVYRSRVDDRQRHDLNPPIVVSDASLEANVTMLISSAGWFSSPSGLLDPTDPSNENAIDDNLRSSIRVFRDSNRDGIEDNS